MSIRRRDRESPPRLIDLPRVGRYVIVGLASASAHLALLVLLVEFFGLRPTFATSLAFVGILLIAFLLQHNWVFRSSERMTRTAPRFTSVAAIAFVLNATIMHVGAGLMQGPYVLFQFVAFIVIPIANYLMHSMWTFAERRGGG